MKQGQSLIEVVVSVGIVGLIVAGMVMLMTNSLNSKTRGFERKKAVEMSEIIMEELVDIKNNDATNFWNINGEYWSTRQNISLTVSGNQYSGYTYVPTIEERPGGSCGAANSWNCAEVRVVITWSQVAAGVGQSAVFTRFFSRY